MLGAAADQVVATGLEGDHREAGTQLGQARHGRVVQSRLPARSGVAQSGPMGGARPVGPFGVDLQVGLAAADEHNRRNSVGDPGWRGSPAASVSRINFS